MHRKFVKFQNEWGKKEKIINTKPSHSRLIRRSSTLVKSSSHVGIAEKLECWLETSSLEHAYATIFDEQTCINQEKCVCVSTLARQHVARNSECVADEAQATKRWPLLYFLSYPLLRAFVWVSFSHPTWCSDRFPIDVTYCVIAHMCCYPDLPLASIGTMGCAIIHKIDKKEELAWVRRHTMKDIFWTNAQKFSRWGFGLSW